ncbi:HNH endonuclease signature motif containing protein [Blastococcus saxobsidens]|uniref:HNH endonuclease n=1 Tax=Blastococcus saxobsidens TaxID=138336 RepID=A0A4Q7Y982_9ACTN|nr:HNH endonuclease signature motif containing protein [Blastococcus saxobsidens]RZU33692.1 HNH endonuclease [Blastococcus saxobsidens]
MRSNDEGGVRPLDELAAAITSGAVRLAAATASWLRMVAEFDARGGWHGVGIRSCGHWLAWQCGMGPGAAREHVRVARALPALPRIEAAFSSGRLSYSKVRALTRIAEPDSEAALLEFALSATAHQTERFCRTWRRIDDKAAAGDQSRAALDQSFESWTDDDGFLVLKIRMPAEQGAPLLTAVEARAERDLRRDRALATKAAAGHAAIRQAGGTVDEDVEDRCAGDAEVGMARERAAARRIAALAELVEAGTHADRRPGDPPRREVVVHVDATVLADDTAAGRAHFEGGPAITGAQARRMLCEATVVAMIEQGREPLAVGRRKRRATRPQRRALLRRDGGCARPGCPETRIERLHAHHLRHWLFGGRTDLDNMVLLCDVDHGLVHDQDLVMSRADGRLVVSTPDGLRVWGAADAAFASGLAGAAPEPVQGDDVYAGVHPFDTTIGRRPIAAPAAGRATAGASVTSNPDPDPAAPTAPTPPTPPTASSRRRAGAGTASRTPRSRRRSHRRSGTGQHPRRTCLRTATGAVIRGSRGTVSTVVETCTRLPLVEEVLFPEGAPAPAGPPQAPYERLDMAHAIGVLMGNRDLVRRLAAESGVPVDG